MKETIYPESPAKHQHRYRTQTRSLITDFNNEGRLYIHLYVRRMYILATDSNASPIKKGLS